MRRRLVSLLALAALASACGEAVRRSPTGSSIDDAFERRQHDVAVEATGVVVRLLPDDDDGSRHQRFVLRLPSGRTVLVAHNVDLAPRVDDLAVGDEVELSGEYEWNPQGGGVHWTHRDPSGRHPAGWLRHRGRTYQ